MRSLVVEDDFVSRRLLQQILSNFGESDVAVDGEEALEVFASAMAEGKSYDVICLDIHMPKLDGMSTLKSLRNIEDEMGLDEEGTKVIMTSGLTDKSTILSAFREGCEAYLQKPFSKENLIEKLEELGFELSR